MTDRPTLPIAPEHLPAVVAALRADGVAYLNVEANIYTTPSAYTTLPEWRELADAVCEMCDGWGKNIGARYASHPPRGDCPYCRGTGKPIHTLTVECPSCEGHYMMVAEVPWTGGLETVDVQCSDCDDGTVSVDVVVAELVPVYDTSGADQPRSFLTIAPAGMIPIGPSMQPGDWVARLETT